MKHLWGSKNGQRAKKKRIHIHKPQSVCTFPFDLSHGIINKHEKKIHARILRLTNIVCAVCMRECVCL